MLPVFGKVIRTEKRFWLSPVKTLIRIGFVVVWLSSWLLATVRAQEPAIGEGERSQSFEDLYARWQRADPGAARAALADDLYGAAIRQERPDVAEEAAAGGLLRSRQVPIHVRARRTPLRVIHIFDDVSVDSDDEHSDAPNQGKSWLARRLTAGALEVWTSTHGWLFDGRGRLRHEARSPGEKPVGREWYGAFLPDGRWVTTDVQEDDRTLSFFSRAGELQRSAPSAELAPPGPYQNAHQLLGWARSNRTGTAWVVNVGSEQGYATVEVGPEEVARPLLGLERWQTCYPRALGARGWYIDLWVPDDAGKVLLSRGAAGHGMYVGYPSYWLMVPDPKLPLPDDNDSKENVRVGNVPDGNHLFGFWPGRRNVYVGATRMAYSRASAPERARLSHDEEATWFFSATGKFQGWLRARRLADAADGRAMLFRLEDSRAVVTLRPDLRAKRVRRFVWPGSGRAAMALSLFDDLRLGLFKRGDKLVLAGW